MGERVLPLRWINLLRRLEWSSQPYSSVQADELSVGEAGHETPGCITASADAMYSFGAITNASAAIQCMGFAAPTPLEQSDRIDVDDQSRPGVEQAFVPGGDEQFLQLPRRFSQ